MLKGVDSMGTYRLDDGPGLFGFSAKNPSKVLSAGNELFLNHFGSFNKIRMQLTQVGEKDITVKASENLPFAVQKGDHVVFRCDPHGNDYIISAIVISEDNNSQEFKAEVDIIEKMKGLKKAKRFNVSIPGEVKIVGVTESVPIVVKKVSLEAVKISCGEDIMIEDVIDTVIRIDDKKKIQFRGRVVKKNKVDNKFDYGLEIYDTTDENRQAMYRYIAELEIS
jgi:hypothetical protein